MTTCKSCEAPVLWITAEEGNSMPVNPEQWTVFTPEGKAVVGKVSHFATCPQAKEWRKTR